MQSGRIAKKSLAGEELAHIPGLRIAAQMQQSATTW
jgi:hypothetical protein